MSHDLIGLWTFLTLNNVELDFVAFLEALVSVDLNGAVMDKNIGPIIAPDKAVAFCVIKPLDFAFVLRHEPCPSLWCKFGWGRRHQPACSKRRRRGWFGLPVILAGEESDEVAKRN